MLTTISSQWSRQYSLSKTNFFTGIITRYASNTANNNNNNNNNNIKKKNKKKKKKNFYEILGVDPTATKAEIKKAYYDLARTMHPDANPDDPAAATAFNALSRAYHVLSDDVRRTAYDASGYNDDDARATDPAAGAAAGGAGSPDGFSVYEQLVRGNVDAFGLGRLFRRITTRGTAPPPPSSSSSSEQPPSADSATGGHRNAVTVTVPVSFAEALAGTSKEVSTGLTVRCAACEGAGEIAAQNAPPKPCGKCGGSGTQPGSQDMAALCKRCGGSGRERAPRCKRCGGAGARWVKDLKVTVNVPQGADDGDVVQVAVPETMNVMDAVFAQVRVVKKHPIFKRVGMDVHVDVPVSLALAALGGPVKIPLLNGSHKLIQIKPGTQSDWVKVIHGEGIKRQGSGRGDLVAHIRVITPASWTRKGRKLLMDYQAEEDRSAKNTRWWKDAYKTWLKFLF